MKNRSNTKILIIILFCIVILILTLVLLRSKPPQPSPQPILQQTPTPAALPTPATTIPPGSGIGGESEAYKRDQLEFAQQHPILQKLPYGHPFFSVEYFSETHMAIYSKTTNRERDYQAARDWFKENGIDISEITLEYIR